jgi:hypothetical protein
MVGPPSQQTFNMWRRLPMACLDSLTHELPLHLSLNLRSLDPVRRPRGVGREICAVSVSVRYGAIRPPLEAARHIALLP